MKYVRQIQPVDAVQWFENGDHPLDGLERHPIEGWLYEGKIVRRFRRPDISGDTTCAHCGTLFNVHGWLERGLSGNNVCCPGSWIITNEDGSMWVCPKEVFDALFHGAEGDA